MAQQGPLCGSFEWVDLTYALCNGLTTWPGEVFSRCPTEVIGVRDEPGDGLGGDSYEYANGSFSCCEHSGTHIDAPRHFFVDGISVENIRLQDLAGPVRVIDVTHQIFSSDLPPIDYSAKPLSTNTLPTIKKRNYQITSEDILQYEEQYGRLQPNELIIFRTGWYQLFPLGPLAYLGVENDGNTNTNTEESLSFPGIGLEAAELLVSRGVKAVGLDTASLDVGDSKDYVAHRLLLRAGIYGIENLNDGVALLPPVGATLMALPMKILGGTGAPARVVALVPTSCVVK